MTLDDACNTFEALFAAVKTDAAHTGATAIVCSGAIGMPDHPPPVICATEELAVTLWARCARDYAMDHAKIEEALKLHVLTWITEPQMLCFKMTIQDQMGAHRVATQRFAVYSVCAITEKPQDVVPECLNMPTAESATPLDPEAKTAPAPKRMRRKDKVKASARTSKN